MFESKYRTRDKGLTKLITEVAGTVRSLNQNLFGSLIEPLTYGKNVFPIATAVQAGVRSHVNRRTCDRPRTYTATHTVTDFTARTC